MASPPARRLVEPVVSALGCGVLVAVCLRLSDGVPLGGAVLSGAVSAAVLAGVWVRIVRRQHRRLAEELGPVDDATLARARRVVEGEAPRDEDERATAAALSAFLAAESRRHRLRTLLGVASALVLAVAWAANRSPVWWVVAALLAGALAYGLVEPRLLARRAERLAAASG